MKKFNRIYLALIILLLCFNNERNLLYSELPAVYNLKEGKILKIRKLVEETIKVHGVVLAICQWENELYFISRLNDDSHENDNVSINEFNIGFLKNGSGEVFFEKKIAVNNKIKFVKKFQAAYGSVYFLNDLNKLYRVGLNRMDISTRQNVIDFTIIDGRLLLLEKNDIGCHLNFNGDVIPISINNPVSIGKVVNGRIIFINNNKNENEIFDVKHFRSFYQFIPGKKYKTPGKYNLKIDLIDIFKKSEKTGSRGLIFYKIFINGNDSGRTETGPAIVNKSYNVKLKTGKFYIIEFERWNLDKSRNRYVRANNIYQPGAIRLYIPEMRIVGLKIKYNGTKYNFFRSVVTE